MARLDTPRRPKIVPVLPIDRNQRQNGWAVRLVAARKRLVIALAVAGASLLGNGVLAYLLIR